MSRQQELGGEEGDFEEARIFYRRVKSQDRLTSPTSEQIESPSELSDVDELLDYIRSRKLRYPIDISETDMDELPKDLAIQVLENGPKEDPVKFLLSQFCDSLRKRQRQANKYAMLIHIGQQFLLAHVRAERGMSIKEEEGEIELIRRFLDVDNILSAALFERTDDGAIKFSHFTDTGSDSFRAFLGVTKRKFHYQKKNVQIITYYKGKTGLECKFEFTNEEFEDKWLNGNELHLQGEQFAFNDERPHLIKEIRWGGEQYESPRSFKSDFKEYSFSLDGERRRYQDLLDLESPEGSSVSIFDNDVERAEDKQDRVEIYYEDVIEYKNKKDLEKDDAASEIVSNIKTKLKDSSEKVFLWGIPEQTRELDGLNTQSWNDDRVTNIEERVNDQLQEDNFDYTDYHMQIIPLGDNGDRWIIAGLIY